MSTTGRRPPAKPPKRDYKVPAAVAVAVVAIGFGLFKVVSGDHGSHKRVVETMEIKVVPPPPPPPPKEPPPPPPPKIVEQKIQPPVEKPEVKPVDEPPPGPLALDAKGGPGGDSFGLAGKQGGADFMSGGNGTKYGHYVIMIRDRIQALLKADERLSAADFRTSIRIKYTPSGKVESATLLHSTGDKEIDDRIKQILASIDLPESVPDDMPALNLRITSKGVGTSG